MSEEPDVYVSEFKLSKEALNLLPINGSMRVVEPLEIECKVRGYKVRTDSVYYYLTKSEENNYEPQVGDYRIRYNYLELGTVVTILGEYKKATIGKYKNRVLFADAGFSSVNKIFEIYRERDKFKQYLVRSLGLLGLIIGVIVSTTSIDK